MDALDLPRLSALPDDRPEADAKPANHEQRREPDRVARRERIRLQDHELGVRGIDPASRRFPDRVFRDPLIRELALGGPRTAAQGQVVAGAGHAFPFIAETQILAEFRRRIFIMPPFLHFRGDDHAGDFRPASHFARPEETSRHQPDEKPAEQGDHQAEDRQIPTSRAAVWGGGLGGSGGIVLHAGSYAVDAAGMPSEILRGRVPWAGEIFPAVLRVSGFM